VPTPPVEKNLQKKKMKGSGIYLHTYRQAYSFQHLPVSPLLLRFEERSGDRRLKLKVIFATNFRNLVVFSQ